ncbi:hypothetical protein CTRI78_v007908 [Colletotrichum trifolii]|uniref:Uncharacterized protein n=1 Tax=Colletotrichum trifolii TaxID=5466 RepID=A0A4R8R617_COLTR|nr:hypothetical protein CTRI78_v007908 [Colletotrichum trifolii]
MNEFVKIDFGTLKDQGVPYERKKRMLDTIFNDIVPYRYEDGPRLFPDMGFYTTLLYNRNDLQDLWPFIYRFHSWVSFLLDDAADYALDILGKVAAALSARKSVDPVVLDMGRLSMEPPEIPELDTAVLRSIEAPHLDFGDVVSWRFTVGPRLFPDREFYFTLLSKRDDFFAVWPLVDKFHSWVYQLAFDDPEKTDLVVKSLRRMRDELPGTVPEVATEVAVPGLFREPTPLMEAINTPSDESAKQQSFKKKTRARRSQQTAHQQPFLAEELKRQPTYSYSGIIRDNKHFAEVKWAYDTHLKWETRLAPEDDFSWPNTTDKEREYVEAMFNSIVNTDNFFELRKARERLKRATASLGSGGGAGSKRKRDMDHDDGAESSNEDKPHGISKLDWDLVNGTKTPFQLLGTVIHHNITDVEIELLCWNLLNTAKMAQLGFSMRPPWSGQKSASSWNQFDTFQERWSAMCDELLDCKTLVHSLTRADWFARFASAPSEERGGKLTNEVLNAKRDVQNQIGREIIKEKTGAKEWRNFEDFRIRTKDGELVYDGSHLGDAAQRDLAMRRS